MRSSIGPEVLLMSLALLLAPARPRLGTRW